MDEYELIGLARWVRPLRHAIVLAVVVCAIFFPEELVAVILSICDDHARRYIDQFIEVLPTGPPR